MSQVQAETREEPSSAAGTGDAKRRETIERVIEDVRPNLIRDGGDCQLVDITGNKVFVKLSGACVMCKLSSMTLEGIQSRLIEELGEFVRLVPVMGGVPASL